MHEVPEEYIQAAYEQILNVHDGKSVHTIKFPMPIGKSICVPTTVNDRIIYAIRQGRLGHSRLVLNRLPFDSSSLTMVLLNLATYNLVCSCFIGDKSKPEPWDKDASKEDLDFWQNHALIFNEEKIIDGSKTESCPWILNEPAISYVKFNRLTDFSSDKIH